MSKPTMPKQATKDVAPKTVRATTPESQPKKAASQTPIQTVATESQPEALGQPSTSPYTAATSVAQSAPQSATITATRTIAAQIARKLVEMKAEDVVALDISELNSWTDCFIIATVTSLGHLRGAVRELRSYLSEIEMPMYHKHKQVGEDGWELIDCGDVVIHLMAREIRAFYDLEKLWYQGKRIEL